MYGNIDHQHEGVTVRLCNKVIQKCHRWCNSFIQSDSQLGGTVEALTCKPDLDYSIYSIDSDGEQEADPLGVQMLKAMWKMIKIHAFSSSKHFVVI